MINNRYKFSKVFAEGAHSMLKNAISAFLCKEVCVLRKRLFSERAPFLSSCLKYKIFYWGTQRISFGFCFGGAGPALAGPASDCSGWILRGSSIHYVNTVQGRKKYFLGKMH